MLLNFFLYFALLAKYRRVLCNTIQLSLMSNIRLVHYLFAFCQTFQLFDQNCNLNKQCFITMAFAKNKIIGQNIIFPFYFIRNVVIRVFLFLQKARSFYTQQFLPLFNKTVLRSSRLSAVIWQKLFTDFKKCLKQLQL